MRRIVAILIVALAFPTFPVSATEDPFEFYIDNEVVVHPGETVQFRIAWHNIVGSERHFSVQLNESDTNLSIDGLPTDWTRVASGRLGETTINVSVLPNSNYETISFSLDLECQEVPEWKDTHSIDVLVSRWSNLNFGANDGSSFYVQQNVNTSFAVNISNKAGFDDMVKINFDTESTWQYGFTADLNNDNQIDLQLADGDDIFINFWVITPSIQDGSPLAGEGPTFKLQAQSSLDSRISSWTFSLEMQTFHNMTIDSVQENLSLEPGDTERLEVTIRNNGNVDTYLDASLKYGNINQDRIEIDNWTVAIFNAFEFRALAPNESRIIEIGFDAPSINLGSFGVELIVMPQSFPQRSRTVEVSSIIEWNRNGVLSSVGSTCNSVEWNLTCQQMLTIENTGNFFEEYTLEVVEQSGMNFVVTDELIGLTKGEISPSIPVNLTTLADAEGFLPASAKIQLRLSDGQLIDSFDLYSLTAPRVDWVWENSADSVNDGRLEIVVTMRNDGNTADGLIIKMTSSYFTDMSFIPPNNAIVEDESEYIRSFEVISIEKGANFTFRAWADIPDDQNSNDEFYLNITANSRLDEEKPFKYSVNTTFESAEITSGEGNSIVNTLGNLVANIFTVIWALKWILLATLASSMMINKSLRDRKSRLEDAALLNPKTRLEEEPEDWMAEFAKKKQAVPEIVQSPQIPSEVFTGMFQAVGGERKPTAAPVDEKLVGAASTVLDHHDSIALKNKMDLLADNIAQGEVSKPHSANVALPDDIKPVTERTIPITKQKTEVPDMVNIEDLDL